MMVWEQVSPKYNSLFIKKCGDLDFQGIREMLTKKLSLCSNFLVPKYLQTGDVKI